MTPRVRGPNVVMTHSYVRIGDISPWMGTASLMSPLLGHLAAFAPCGLAEGDQVHEDEWPLEHLWAVGSGSNWCWSLPEAHSSHVLAQLLS